MVKSILKIIVVVFFCVCQLSKIIIYYLNNKNRKKVQINSKQFNYLVVCKQYEIEELYWLFFKYSLFFWVSSFWNFENYYKFLLFLDLFVCIYINENCLSKSSYKSNNQILLLLFCFWNNMDTTASSTSNIFNHQYRIRPTTVDQKRVNLKGFKNTRLTYLNEA